VTKLGCNYDSKYFYCLPIVLVLPFTPQFLVNILQYMSLVEVALVLVLTSIKHAS
jgi:hypothetical protein